MTEVAYRYTTRRHGDWQIAFATSSSASAGMSVAIMPQCSIQATPRTIWKPHIMLYVRARQTSLTGESCVMISGSEESAEAYPWLPVRWSLLGQIVITSARIRLSYWKSVKDP